MTAAAAEGDGGAAEFLGLLDAHFARRAELEQDAAAQDRPLAALEGWPAWREMTGPAHDKREGVDRGHGRTRGRGGAAGSPSAWRTWAPCSTSTMRS